ncbi:uncharacterized protein AFUA_2G10390 [Aspergillus fumigatus Af293]|uniref:Uncharacterized protein n=2 Tax=Aspergillus fumigatus TaxID=746128 RepID=Q4X1D1_ASPFU|nr:hypothetical protein AFUA_2G10390 [Aspergillus fumigatus Af293]EAL93334.1 hypothetical protein AFUA_2G10390 [Aspergillus fumigatus Af293]EDP54561.1 hypothetical protein AFUB_026200 [Aspergillus fumigatus A1163]
MHETDGILMKQMNARAQLKSLEGANKAEMKGGDGRRNLSDGISNERQEAVGFDQRFLWGLYVCNAPSQFLEEIIRVRVKEMEGGRNGWNTDDLCAT